LLLSDKHPKFSEKRGARQAFWFIFFHLKLFLVGLGLLVSASLNQQNVEKKINQNFV
jgi:hypothetical protein